MIKTWTNYEKARADIFRAYSKKPKQKEEVDKEKVIHNLFFNDSDKAVKYRDTMVKTVLKAFAGSGLYNIVEVIPDRLYRIHKATHFSMNLSFSFDNFRIAVFDMDSKNNYPISHVTYRNFTGQVFTRLAYTLGRFMKAMDGGVHPEIVAENMKVERLLDELN